MTASWRDRGKWEAYQRDFEERFSNKPHVVRPSSLSLEDYADVYVGQRAREYLESYDRAEPWCCWVSFGGPHEPWDAPEPYASMYDPSTMPPPVAHSPQDHPRPQGELDRLLANRPDLTPDEVAAMRANYAGNVSLIDDQIGQILAAVEARGELGNTAIAFSSDHGEHNGDCGLIYKETFLNGAVRVPLLLRTPATARGSQSDRICSAPVEWFDIGPTLVELAGGEIDYPQFARSLTPLLEDPTRRHRGEAISELKGEIMLLDERWKGALNAEGQVYMLFDVQSDPEESTNLAGLPEMRATEEKLRLRILERLVQSQLRGSAYRFDLHQS
jgi:choline-sulfatase